MSRKSYLRVVPPELREQSWLTRQRAQAFAEEQREQKVRAVSDQISG